MPVIFQTVICRDDLQANPSVLYLFGDNEERRGMGGQAAAMRGEPNAVGIRTKRKASHDPDAFWTDETYSLNVQKVDHDLLKVLPHLTAGGLVVIPSAGLGTGLARLHENAPRTLEYIEDAIKTLARLKPLRNGGVREFAQRIRSNVLDGSVNGVLGHVEVNILRQMIIDVLDRELEK